MIHSFSPRFSKSTSSFYGYGGVILNTFFFLFLACIFPLFIPPIICSDGIISFFFFPKFSQSTSACFLLSIYFVFIFRFPLSLLSFTLDLILPFFSSSLLPFYLVFIFLSFLYSLSFTINLKFSFLSSCFLLSFYLVFPLISFLSLLFLAPNLYFISLSPYFLLSFYLAFLFISSLSFFFSPFLLLFHLTFLFLFSLSFFFFLLVSYCSSISSFKSFLSCRNNTPYMRLVVSLSPLFNHGAHIIHSNTSALSLEYMYLHFGIPAHVRIFA